MAEGQSMDNIKVGQQRSDLGVSHNEVRERLAEYATGIMLGRDVRHEYQAVAEHLDSCLICQAELLQLLRLGGALYRGEVEPAPLSPTFQLDFLSSAHPPATEKQPPWWRDGLGRLIVQFSPELLATIGLAQPLMATRGAGTLRYQPQADPPKSFYLTIDILKSRSGQGHVDLQIQVDFAERSPLEQDNTLVQANAGGHTWRGLTDASGLVALEQIPRILLPNLRLVIEPPGIAGGL
jgi:hypothetical protein